MHKHRDDLVQARCQQNVTRADNLVNFVEEYLQTLAHDPVTVDSPLLTKFIDFVLAVPSECKKESSLGLCTIVA